MIPSNPRFRALLAATTLAASSLLAPALAPSAASADPGVSENCRRIRARTGAYFRMNEDDFSYYGGYHVHGFLVAISDLCREIRIEAPSYLGMNPGQEDQPPFRGIMHYFTENMHGQYRRDPIRVDRPEYLPRWDQTLLATLTEGGFTLRFFAGRDSAGEPIRTVTYAFGEELSIEDSAYARIEPRAHGKRFVYSRNAGDRPPHSIDWECAWIHDRASGLYRVLSSTHAAAPVGAEIVLDGTWYQDVITIARVEAGAYRPLFEPPSGAYAAPLRFSVLGPWNRATISADRFGGSHYWDRVLIDRARGTFKLLFGGSATRVIGERDAVRDRIVASAYDFVPLPDAGRGRPGLRVSWTGGEIVLERR